jgi:hypothetical protein
MILDSIPAGQEVGNEIEVGSGNRSPLASTIRLFGLFGPVLLTFEANYSPNHGDTAFDPATASQEPAELQNATAASWHA